MKTSKGKIGFLVAAAAAVVAGFAYLSTKKPGGGGSGKGGGSGGDKPMINGDDDMPQSAKDDSDTYYTPPEYAVISDPGGWVNFRGTQVTSLPLTDSRTGLFARLKYDDAKKAADLLGGELLEEKDFAHIHEAAHDGSGDAIEIAPVELVATKDDTLRMASLTFARKHDAKVHDELTAAKWNGSVPVSNIGKYWLDGGYNFGWYDPNATGRDVDQNALVQSKGGMHIDQNGQNHHIDYSQVTMLKKSPLASVVSSVLDYVT